MSTESIAAAIRESGDRRSPLRIAGRGSWLDAGRPVRAQSTISMSDETGVVSYVPGDLTLTVRSGTALSAIAQVTREHSQWLPLDPYGSPDGSIGATIATASAGPLSSSFGLPRDLVLGIEFVNGRGEVIRGGGKVVKNVAGFDLSRLLTGSWGTLGVITEVTLRLYALPKADRTFAIPLVGSERDIAGVVHAVSISPLVPFALQLLSPTAARALGVAHTAVCLIRLGGNESAVRAQTSALSQLAKPEEIDVAVWDRLRTLESGAHTTLRISALPRRVIAMSARILGDEVPGIFTYIDPRRGILRVIAGAEREHFAANESVDLRAEGDSSTQIVYERLEPELWPLVSPSAVADPLSQGIKRAYDPYNVLNPGILGEVM